jgi:hypothetical protein
MCPPPTLMGLGGGPGALKVGASTAWSLYEGLLGDNKVLLVLDPT